MSTHPAEAMDGLSVAVYKLLKLQNEAAARGDPEGAHAWSLARDAALHAEDIARAARQLQTWGGPEPVRIEKPPRGRNLTE